MWSEEWINNVDFTCFFSFFFLKIYFIVKLSCLIFRLPSCTIMQGIRCACRRAGSVAQILLGKQRSTIATPRWSRLAYQPTASFHSMFIL